VPAPRGADEALSAWATPNPFRAGTTVRFRLGEAGFARVEVFDATGRRVERLLERWLPAGGHSATFLGEGLPSGLYHVRVSAGDRVRTVKVAKVE
jgi:hypothetical protein